MATMAMVPAVAVTDCSLSKTKHFSCCWTRPECGNKQSAYLSISMHPTSRNIGKHLWKF